MTKKILYSPGYGAGWSTWMGGYSSEKSNEVKKFACEYKPIIDAIESGDKMWEHNEFPQGQRVTTYHPLIVQFQEDCIRECGLDPDDYICVLGCSDLEVVEIPDGAKYRITEYDGYESVEFRDDIDWME